jgi:hypothetical protein
MTPDAGPTEVWPPTSESSVYSHDPTPRGPQEVQHPAFRNGHAYPAPIKNRKIENLVHKLATQDRAYVSAYEPSVSSEASQSSCDVSRPPGFRGVPAFRGNAQAGRASRGRSFLAHGLEPPPDLDLASNVSGESLSLATRGMR